MKRVIIGAWLLMALSFCAMSQSMQRVKKVVQELSSPTYYGRGYTHKGDSLAADYIARYLRKMGINAVGDSYYQHFPMDINTYVGTPLLTIDGNQLRNGIDWVAYPNSPGVKGTYPFQWISANMLTSKQQLNKLLASELKETFVCFDSTITVNEQLHYFARNLFTSNRLMVKGIVDCVESPKYSARRYVNDYVTLRVRQEWLKPSTDSITIDLENQFIRNYQTQNVSGFIQGQTDTCVTLIAHYDHLGTFGEAVYAGANDNASGVAMLLELARHFHQHPPHYSIQLIFFSAEEASFYGSEYYVANPLYPLEKTKLVINFDMVASGTDWTELIHAELYPSIKRQFLALNKSGQYIKHLKPTGYDATSDHYHFHDAGIPALFFWTAGGNEDYHEPLDTAEKLDYPVFEGIYQLVVDFLEQYR